MAVSLVVPVRNEFRSLPSLIESIAAQTLPPDEVVFVDAGSTDGTTERLRAACLAREEWRLVESGPATPGRARNIGIDATSSEWIALTDAGIELDPHWLERLVREVEASPGTEMVYGHYEPAPQGFFTDCAALAYVAPPTSTDRGPMRARSIASCLLRRDLWQRAGPFPDQRAAEDRQLMRRVEAVNASVALAPEASVRWELQPGFVSTFRRFRTYSRVNAMVGEQRSWHYGVARMYALAIPCIGLTLRRRCWLGLPVLGLLTRVIRGTWRRREGRGVLWACNPARLATVASILLIVDAATFWGWTEAFVERRRSRAGAAHPSGGTVS